MRIRQALRAAGTFRWLALAGGLIVAVWVVTFQWFTSAAPQIDERRVADRGEVARIVAARVGEVLDQARADALVLAGDAAGRGARVALADWLSRPNATADDGLVVDRAGIVLAARIPDRAAAVGRPLAPCEPAGEETLADAVRRTFAGPPHVSSVVGAPGDCGRSVAATARGADAVAVALVHPSRLGEAAASATLLDGGAARVYVVDAFGDGVLVTRPTRDALPLVTVQHVPERVFAAAQRGGSERYESPAGMLVGAAANVTAGWTLLIESDAAVFDIAQLPPLPALLTAGAISAALALAFVLLTVAEVRRRRAHRRAEVAKSDFLSIAGHEFRTPLTALSGFAETLSGRWDDLDDARRKMLVDRLVPQVRRLSRTIERTLTASNIHAGTHARPRPKPIDLAESLERVAEKFAGEAPLHRFDVDVEPGLPAALADRAAIDVVLEQIVENAVKYSPAGGRVGLIARRARRSVQLIVEDEGVGLPQDARRIFDPLVQGEDVDRRLHAEGGVGVGLFIVKTLVAQMGGRVRAERRDVAGSRLIVSLKAATARTEHAPTSA